jgi:hypothetical protein
MSVACKPQGSEQRSVNPGLAIREAGVDAALGDGETSAAPTSPGLPSNVVSTDSSKPSLHEAGVVRGVDAGPPRVVYWGLQPGSPGPDAGLADEALARLEVLALGSRIMTYVSTGEQDDFAAIASSPDMDWVMTLPSEVFAAMDDAALSAWVERVWQLGDAVRFLILGQHLETDLVALPSAERGLLAQRLESTLLQARGHAAKPADASVGVGLVTFAYVPTGLLAASEVVALSYSGVKPSGEVPTPEDAYEELHGRVEESTEFRLPVILQDLAYPSVNGDEAQRAFFARVNQWFSGPNAPDVRAVVVSSLNTPALTDCESWAEQWQISNGAEVRHSIGMRHVGGEPKPALNEVIELLAEFAQL